MPALRGTVQTARIKLRQRTDRATARSKRGCESGVPHSDSRATAKNGFDRLPPLPFTVEGKG